MFNSTFNSLKNKILIDAYNELTCFISSKYYIAIIGLSLIFLVTAVYSFKFKTNYFFTQMRLDMRFTTVKH